MSGAPALSHGTLLGGRIAYAQPLDGYRTGIEPILLAASIPARPGDRVVEAGTGAGAGLLALVARLGALSGLGIERDADLAGIARANVMSNGLHDVEIVEADVTVWRPAASWDHAMANPPWHDAAGTPSPVAGRRGAKVAGPDLMGRWCVALARALRQRGTLTLILPTALVPKGMRAMCDAGCGEISLLPLWSKAGQPARLAILRGVRNGSGACRILPGLTLHDVSGGYTEDAEHVLRRGSALPF